MTKNSNKDKEECCKELYRLLIFYKFLVKLLEYFFEGGYILILDDDINKNYLRLSHKINQILDGKCFENYNIQVELPYDNLRSIDPDAPKTEWEYHGRKVCGDSLSEIEDLFIKTGEKSYALAEDGEFLRSIDEYLTTYNNFKKAENRKFIDNVQKEAKNHNPFKSQSSEEKSNIELKINPNIWTYVEKLYLDVYRNSNDFVSFLKNHGVSGYKNSSYPLILSGEEEHTDKDLFWTFMRDENCEFPDFMRSIPYNIQLNILSDIIFDDDIQRTQYINWNYHGEKINQWYPKIINYLESAGLKINFKRHKIILGYEILEFWDLIHEKIIIVSKKRFDNGHYSDAVESAFKEINISVKEIVKSKTGTEYDGHTLMDTGFSFSKTSSSIILLGDLSTISGRNIQKGYKKLFSGSIQAIRNPNAHGNDEITKEEAIHLIFLASHLMFKLHSAMNI
jgi:uncharacterized protein (TIGR02391 family)